MDRNKRDFDDIERGQDAAEAGFRGHPDDVEDNRDRKLEKKLDHGLKETFPASDPVSINPGAD